MKRISFFIKGNQENSLGNPIPYTRVTQGSKWSDRSIRYSDWKSYVQGAFIKYIKSIPKTQRDTLERYIDFAEVKPIKDIKVKQKMDIKAFFVNEAHPDTDNVFKGIADALFKNDKHLIGSFDYTHDAEFGGVSVIIYFEI